MTWGQYLTSLCFNWLLPLKTKTVTTTMYVGCEGLKGRGEREHVSGTGDMSDQYTSLMSHGGVNDGSWMHKNLIQKASLDF